MATTVASDIRATALLPIAARTTCRFENRHSTTKSTASIVMVGCTGSHMPNALQPIYARVNRNACCTLMHALAHCSHTILLDGRNALDHNRRKHRATGNVGQLHVASNRQSLGRVDSKQRQSDARCYDSRATCQTEHRTAVQYCNLAWLGDVGGGTACIYRIQPVTCDTQQCSASCRSGCSVISLYIRVG
jgi:hypothetical protein